MKSIKGQLNKEEWLMLWKQSKKYVAPLILVFLLALQRGTPLKEAAWLVYGAALQVAINFISKLSQGE
jgi:hypothetical protein